MADWFTQNAPKAAPAAGQDWFASNAPKVNTDLVDAQLRLMKEHLDTPWYKKAWDTLNTPTLDLGAGTGVTAKALMTHATGDPMLYDNIRASQSQGPTEADAQHPVRYGIKQGVGGVMADTADTIASFTSPLSAATMAAGAVAKVPGAVGKIARVGTTAAATGFGAKGAADVVDAGMENTPEAWQKRLQGGAAMAGGTAALVHGAAPQTGKAPISTVPSLVGESIGEAGNAAKGATRAVAAKIVPALIDGPPEDLITRAVKPRNKNTGWEPAVKSAMPNLKLAEQELGKPVAGLDDALEATTLAKKSIWKQYQDRLGPNANAEIDGNVVADAMMKSIDRRTATQNPQLAERVATVADTYRRPMTLAEAEEFLQSANNDLHNYYAKNKVGQRVAQGDPEKAYTVAEANALRSELYSRLDDLGGPGAAELKKQYGALSNIEEEMLNRKNVAARQNPQSLSEQLSIAGGYGKIAKGVVTFSPGDIAEGAETIGKAKYLKERNSTDAMIERAFAAYKTPSGPSVAPPTAPNIAGLLPSGPVVTPPPADISGTTPAGYRPPPVAATTRAQRLGLLLPEQTSKPLPAWASEAATKRAGPPVDATTRAVRKGLLLPEKTSTPLPAWAGDSATKVLKAKSVLQRDPKTGRMRRMYLTSGQ